MCNSQRRLWVHIFYSSTFIFFAGRFSCFVDGKAANIVLAARVASAARWLFFWCCLDCRSVASVLQLMAGVCQQLRGTCCLQSVYFLPCFRWICWQKRINTCPKNHVRFTLALVYPSLGLPTWLEVQQWNFTLAKQGSSFNCPNNYPVKLCTNLQSK